MSSIIHSKEYIELYLPEGIDPNAFTGNGERPARIAYFGHVLTTRPYANGREFININSAKLRSQITNKAYDAACEYFKDSIEIDHSYSAGISSKGYRWKSEYRQKRTVRHSFKCPHFIRHLDRYENNIRRDYSDRAVDLDLVLREVSLPIDIEQLVSNIPSKSGVKDENHRRNVIRASCLDIQQGRRGLISKSETTGRVYCNINNLSKYVRPHLQLYGESVVEIDLASSQPYFLATIADIPALCEAVAQGQFYQVINGLLDTPVDFEDKEQYADFKKKVLAHLYARPKHEYDYTADPRYANKDIAEAMEKAFPGINAFIRDYRERHGDKALPIALQRKESEIFISHILSTLHEMGIPAIPIHDSILCPISDVAIVSDVIFQTLVNITGIIPTLNVSKRVYMGSMSYVSSSSSSFASPLPFSFSHDFLSL